MSRLTSPLFSDFTPVTDGDTIYHYLPNVPMCPLLTYLIFSGILNGVFVYSKLIHTKPDLYYNLIVGHWLKV